MYYTIQNNVLLKAENKEALEMYDNVQVLPSDYVEGKYVVFEGKLVLNPNYEEEKAEIRKQEFEIQFFEIPNVGYFRKKPKGYGSAVESLNTAFNMVTVMGMLPANTLTFYSQPDFTDETQCTEEWLIENSFKNAQMTIEEFGKFYASFLTAWNNQEHL